MRKPREMLHGIGRDRGSAEIDICELSQTRDARAADESVGERELPQFLAAGETRDTGIGNGGMGEGQLHEMAGRGDLFERRIAYLPGLQVELAQGGEAGNGS